MDDTYKPIKYLNLNEATPTIQSMTLRQNYAGLAMQGILAAYAHPKSGGTENMEVLVARVSVKFADALLVALLEPQKGE